MAHPQFSIWLVWTLIAFNLRMVFTPVWMTLVFCMEHIWFIITLYSELLNTAFNSAMILVRHGTSEVLCESSVVGGFPLGPAYLRRFVEQWFYKRVVLPQTWTEWMFGCHRIELIPDYELIGRALVLVGCLLALVCIPRKRKQRPRVDPLSDAPEGLVPGNPLLEGGRLPKGQVAIAMKKDGLLYIVGGGFRMGDHLITPTHNCHSGYEMWMVNGTLEAKVDVESEISIAADVSAFAVPASTWSRLQIPTVKLGPLRDVATVTVTSSCDLKHSVASLKATQPMGRCVYAGSTMPGFSGSLYMNGTVALGMHCHGGYRGGGYECLYLYVRLTEALDKPPEDSPDFFMQIARDGGFDFEDLGGSAVIMRTRDGQYHRTKQEVLQRMRELDRDDWADEVEYEELEQQLSQYPECKAIPAQHLGEDRRPARKVVSAPTLAASNSRPVLTSSDAKTEPLPTVAKVLVPSKRKRSGKRQPQLQQQILNCLTQMMQSNKLVQSTGRQTRPRRRSSVPS